MASTQFVIALGAAAFIFFWHVFVIMQITPQVADFLSAESTQSTDPQLEPTYVEDEPAATKHYRVANLMLEELHENFSNYSSEEKYRLASLTKEHLDIVCEEVEGTETEWDIKEAQDDLNTFLKQLES